MGNPNRPVVTEGYWEARHYGTLGLLDIVTPEGYLIAEDIEKSIAEHIVDLHNKAWDAFIWASYSANLAYSNYVQALTEDDWFDYSDFHEPTQEQD